MFDFCNVKSTRDISLINSYPNFFFNLRVRAKATGISSFTNWSMNAVIGKITPLLLKGIDFYTYTIFGTMGIIMGIYSFYVPETKGKSIEAMDEIFGGEKTVKVAGMEKLRTVAGGH